MIFNKAIKPVANLILRIVRQKPLELCSNPCRPNFLFQKPSAEVRAHHRQEVLAFPQSLLSVRAQLRHKDRDAPSWASASARAALRKLTALRL